MVLSRLLRSVGMTRDRRTTARRGHRKGLSAVDAAASQEYSAQSSANSPSNSPSESPPESSDIGLARVAALRTETANARTATAGDGPPQVWLKNISKHFGPVKANDDITLAIRSGRILALLGENGAGKSTLMSVLAGRYQPDSGRIEMRGKRVQLATPREAIHRGIGMVYQHFRLVESMTVASNVLLGQEESALVDPATQEARVAELAARFGMTIDPAALVCDLSMGERQRVEILKLLARDSEVLIFDEPTAVLTPPEAVKLFESFVHMARLGKAIVFISHKLDEVLAMADDIAVLRRGRIVATVDPSEVPTRRELASLMVGREVLLAVDRPVVDVGEVVLETDSLCGKTLTDVSFRVRRGEVLAVVGVAGNGQRELAEVLYGMRTPASGRVTHDAPLAYIPEDRKGLAATELDMVENVLLTTAPHFTTHGMLDRSAATQRTRQLVERFDVRPPLVRTPAGKLSGGNLQKLVIAREFSREPRVIVAEQPTQGLDVGSTEDVWAALLSARSQAGVLVITGDVGEALQLADRVAVIYEGRLVGEVVPRPTCPDDDPAGPAPLCAERTRDAKERIGLLMAGSTSG